MGRGRAVFQEVPAGDTKFRELGNHEGVCQTDLEDTAALRDILEEIQKKM